MRRPSRGFRVDSFELEGRRLLTAAHASIRDLTKVQSTVGFVGSNITSASGTSTPSVVATQQAGQVTVSIAGYTQTSGFQALVATDPSSPAVGVNVGAVNQTVTFTKGASQATVTVPIIAGAPNPGEVDVNLTITPINPPANFQNYGPLELRILASDALIPPHISSAHGTRKGIVLTFTKPMNPVSASDVNNYAVSSMSTTTKSNPFFAPFNFLTAPLHPDSPGLGYSYSTSIHKVPITAAQYNPATNTVLLIPKRRINYSASISVSQSSAAKTSIQPGSQSNSSQGLTDLDGNPINSDTTPGKFTVFVNAA